MEETKPEAELEPAPEAEPEPAEKPFKFKIQSKEDLKDILQILKGLDPDAIQSIAKFMDMDSELERSYFPDRITALAVGQVEGYSEALYKGRAGNGFSIVAKCLSVAFMGYKGFKSDQYVEITRDTPNLKDLQSAEGAQKGIMDRIFNRGKSE